MMGCAGSKDVDAVKPSANGDTSVGGRGSHHTVKPPKKKKKAIVPPDSFASIDEFALKAPRNAASSVQTLSQYLVKTSRTDVEKVRAFFRWITENIGYDASGFFRGDSGPQDAESVLRLRRSVCEGYANLFKALCDEADIPCKKVHGFSKGFSYNAEVPFTPNTETNHAWNIVYVGGEWRHIESTWGAGHLTQSHQYEKCFKEIYFLTDPEDFIIEHFPYEKNNTSTNVPFQLLKKPWSLDQFSTSLKPHVKGITFGFVCSSHKTQVVDVHEECEVVFKTRNVKLQAVVCHLKESNTGKDYKQFVLLRKNGDLFTAKITPPSESKYEFGLFGQPEGSSGNTFDALISFIVRCKSAKADVIPYPETNGTWGAHANTREYGFAADIFKYDVIRSSSGEAEIRLKADKQIPLVHQLVHAQRVSDDLERYTFDYYDGNILILKVRLPYTGHYKLSLFAKHPLKAASPSYDHVSDILIDNTKALNDAQPFPETYPSTNENGCQIDPLIGNLPANREARFRVRSEKLIRIMVLSQQYKKGKDGSFDVVFKPKATDGTVVIFGTASETGSLSGLYKFNIV